MDENITHITPKKIKTPDLNLNIFLILSSLFFLVFMSSPNIVFAAGDRDFRGYESREGFYGDNAFRNDPRGEKGNGATGGIAALLLVLANVTVLLSLIIKGLNSLFSLSPETRTSISAFNKAQKRYLRGMHYILNPTAIGVAVVHFYLSSCRSMLPDMTLILFLFVGVLGLILKFKLSPKSMYKAVYGLHCSSVTFVALIFLLAIGHA
jgi:hypothetical protein